MDTDAQTTIEAPPTCVLCDTPVSGEAGGCPSCQMPIALSAKFQERETPPQFVSIVGPSGSGKTVYLGMMIDILTNGTDQLQGRIGDSFSVAVQEQTITALQRQGFPQKTSSESDSWNWVHCEVNTVKNRNKVLDLIAPDFAGEAISMEMDCPNSYPAIPGVLSRSRAVVMLCDAMNVRDNAVIEDLFAMKLASYIHSRMLTSKRVDKAGKTDIPLAIVLTKSDSCPDVSANVADFAKNNLPRLVNYCSGVFSNFRLFHTSVVGSQATLVDNLGRRWQIPIHTEMQGITEPIEWIFNVK
jgi:hypothetical protein